MHRSSDELLTKEVAFYWFLFNYEDVVTLDGVFASFVLFWSRIFNIIVRLISIKLYVDYYLSQPVSHDDSPCDHL